jgi:uncharacterized protein (DUF3084 family)
VSLVHEQVNTILQLKTASKIANDLVAEKDQIISQLTLKITELESTSVKVDDLEEKAKIWEESYKAMANKITHMDTLTRQIVDMKAMIQERDQMITSLQEKITNLMNPPKVKPVKVKKIDQIATEQSPKDDF